MRIAPNPPPARPRNAPRCVPVNVSRLAERVTMFATAADLKRAQIVEAARVVLARDGLGGCTARAVADAGPLTKSAIHYYFHDVDEIVDKAMEVYVATMVANLRARAASVTDPQERLRVVLRGVPGHVRRAAACGLPLVRVLGRGRSAGARTLEAVVALLSWLLGTVVQQQLRPLPSTELILAMDDVVRRLLSA